MKKALAKGLLVMIEAGVDVPAKRIRKSGKRNGATNRLRHLRDGGGSYGLPDRLADHSLDMDNR